jgi:type I restriction enzyme M protein
MELKPRATERKHIKAKLGKLIEERARIIESERQQHELSKEERAIGDAIYWPIYNLDIKNPKAIWELEHLQPENLVDNIMEKEQSITAIMAEIKRILLGV